MTWVYLQSEPGLWTVGFYSPDGRWNPDSDHSNREEAAQRCRFLNGGEVKAKTEEDDQPWGVRIPEEPYQIW